jgi:polyisoprenoid-binding protein YceI
MATYTIDYSHSDVGFSVRHMVFAKVRGHFAKWTANLVFDEANPAKSSVEATIEAATIDTREAQRDGHLRSPDFLDAEKYPQLTFKSKRVESEGKGRFKVTGDLTIRGVTHEVPLEVEELGTGKDPWGNEKVGFHAKTTINRTDWGLKWNQALEAGGVLVGEKVDIELDIEAVKKA